MEIVRVAVVVLVICSVTPSKAETSAPPSGGGDAHSMPCIQKLIPCQPYLHSTTPPPPLSCCAPLREIVESDVTCLCSVFNNVDMLKSLNLTKENALVLPKACGANADVSQCKNSAAKGNTTSPATPKTPPASSTGSDSTGASSSSMAKPSSSLPTSNFVGHSFASALMALATIFF